MSSNTQKRTVLLCYIRFKPGARCALMHNLLTISRQQTIIQPIKFTESQQSTVNLYLSRIFPSFSWGIFGHVTRLDQSRERKDLMDDKLCCVIVIYEFFECSTNIPSGLSAYKPQKLVAYCFNFITQKTRDFSVSLSAQ